jgi:L-cysteine/cystine lyase
MTFPSYGAWDWEAETPYTPRTTAARFDPGWTPSASAVGLLESLAFAQEAGEDRFEHARAMAARCCELLAQRVEVITEPDQATLVTWKAEGDATEALARLAEAGVIARELPDLGWLRASCGFWTSEDDLQRLVSAL